MPDRLDRAAMYRHFPGGRIAAPARREEPLAMRLDDPDAALWRGPKSRTARVLMFSISLVVPIVALVRLGMGHLDELEARAWAAACAVALSWSYVARPATWRRSRRPSDDRRRRQLTSREAICRDWWKPLPGTIALGVVLAVVWNVPGGIAVALASWAATLALHASGWSRRFLGSNRSG